MEYYEIKFKGYSVTVYDTNKIIEVVCDLVNGCGANEEDIEIITYNRK